VSALETGWATPITRGDGIQIDSSADRRPIATKKPLPGLWLQHRHGVAARRGTPKKRRRKAGWTPKTSK
jgi:hypothetical protein